MSFDMQNLKDNLEEIGNDLQNMFNSIEASLGNISNTMATIGLAISIFDRFDNSIEDSINNLQESITKSFSAITVKIGSIDFEDGSIKTLLDDTKTSLNVSIKDSLKIDTTGIENSFKQVGAMITAGIIHGMQKGSLEEESKEEFDKVLDATKKLFEIQSPSKVMERLGKYISEGLEIGIRKGSDDVVDAARDLGDGIDDEIGGREFSFGGLGAAFGVITAIGGAFTALMSTNEEFGAAVDAVWSQITEAFAPVTDAVMNLITSLGEEGMGGSFSWFTEALSGVAELAVSVIVRILLHKKIRTRGTDFLLKTMFLCIIQHPERTLL